MYLWGKPKEAYEPEQSELADRKIADGRAMLSYISKQRDLVPGDQMDALIKRYEAVEQGIKHWQKIKIM